MSYTKIIVEAIESFLGDYAASEYIPVTESDIHGYIFLKCIEGCNKYRLPKEVHINHKVKLLGSKKKIDIVLGINVAVEVKFEANYPGVSKPVVFKEEVLKDLVRLDFLRKNGLEKTIFIFLDEDGEHYRNTVNRYNLPQSDWTIINRNNHKTYILML